MESGKFNLSSCKLIEIGENGELKLIKDNLDQVLKHFKEKLPENKNSENLPIAVVSVLGPPLSGKSFFTNLLIEYLKHDGKNWTKNIRKNDGIGLEGFPYGSGDNFVVAGQNPDEDKFTSGVYFWPQLFPLNNCQKLLCVMHVVNRKPQTVDEKQKPVIDPLNIFLEIASSRILDIVWKQMSVTETLLNLDTAKLKSLSQHLLPSILHVHRQPSNEEWKMSTSNQDRRQVVTMKNYMEPLHNKKGVVSFKPAQAFEKIIRQLIDEANLHTKKVESQSTELKIQLFPHFLNYCLQLVNVRISSVNSNDHWPTGTFNEIHKSSFDNSNVNPGPGLQNVSDLKNGTQNGSNENVRKNLNSMIDQETDIDNLATKLQTLSIVNEKEPNFLNGNKIVYPNPEKIKQEILARPILPKLKNSLEKWISKHLERENIGHVSGLFDSTLNQLIQQEVEEFQSKGLSQVQIQKLIQDVKKELENDADKEKHHFITATEKLEEFCRNIEVTFEATLYFSRKELKDLFKRIAEKISAKIENSDITNLFKTGVAKLTPFFEKYNDSKIQDEQIILADCINQIKTFYQQEMTMILQSNQNQSPGNLLKVHNRLVSDLFSIFKTITGTTPDISKQLENLQYQLNDEFLKFEQKNMNIIEVKQKTLKRFILTWKSKYEMELDELLEPYPDGLELEKFDKKAEEIKEKTISNFKLQGKGNLQEKFLDKYVMALETYIEKSRHDFRNDNQEHLNDAMGIANNCTPGPSCENKPVQIEKPNEDHKQVQIRQSNIGTHDDNPPLFFQLGLESIGIGIMKQKFVKEVYHEPPEVGRTHNDEWIFGSNVYKLVNSHGQGILKSRWHIAKIFLLEQKSKLKETVTINGVELPITKEFLFALFFQSFKDSEETQQNRTISDALVTVPFWYSSTQRQRILDAAKLAGFTNVNIYNENSSVAYYVFSSGNDFLKNGIVVISENSDIVDITIYSADSKQDKLSMISHCGDCDTNNSTGEGNSNWLLLQISKLLLFPREANEEHLTLQNVEKMCVKALERAKKSTNMKQPIQFYIFSQSLLWTDRLAAVSQKFTSLSNIRIIQNYEPFYGLAAIRSKICRDNVDQSNDNNVMYEGMPFYVNIFSPFEERRVVFIKKDTFAGDSDNRKPLVETCFFQAHYGIYSVRQQNAFTNSQIANLNIKNIPTGSKKKNVKHITGIAVTLSRSSDGIISLEKLEWTFKTFTNLIGRIPIETQDYEWVHFNMMDETKGTYLSIMDHVKYCFGISKWLLKKKQLIVEKCEKIMKSIEVGCGAFQNSIVKTLVRKEVQDIMEQVKRPEVRDDEIKHLRTRLENMSLKYNLDCQ